MVSSCCALPTGPKAYLEAGIKISTDWLEDDRLSNLPNQINDKNFEYTGYQIGICNELNTFVQEAGDGLRRLQRKERDQALPAQLDRSYAPWKAQPRKTPSRYEQLQKELAP